MINYLAIADELDFLPQDSQGFGWGVDHTDIELHLERHRLLSLREAERKEEAKQIRDLRAVARKHGIIDWPAIHDLPESDIPDFLCVQQLLLKGNLISQVKRPPVYRLDMSLGLFNDSIVVPPVKACLEIYRARASDTAFTRALALHSHEFLSAQSHLIAQMPPRRLDRILEGVGRARAAGLLPNWLQVRGTVGLKLLYILGTVDEPTYWALVFERGRKPIAKPLDLNWDYLRRAKRSPALRFACLPRVQQWERLFGGKPPNQSIPAPGGIKTSAVKQLAAEFDVPLQRGVGNHATEAIATIRPLFNLVRLFGDAANVRQFMKKRGYPMTRVGLHDAGQFTMPREALGRPAHWRSLCLRAPTAIAWTSSFRQLEQNDVYPTTVAELENAVVRIQFKNIPDHQLPLAKLCISAKLSRDVFKTYAAFWSNVEVKPKDLMPEVTLSGESIGLAAGWQFTKLAPTDLRGPMLGQFTGCCQHLTGAGSACARHGVESPYSGFYVITYRGRVMAQSWAWLDNSGNFVFDSIETIHRDRMAEISALYNAAANLIAAQLSAGVFLGDTSFGHGAAIIPQGQTGSVYIQQPADLCDYMDGTNQWHWAGAIRGRNRKAPRVSGYRPNRGLDPQLTARATLDFLWQDLMQDQIGWLDDAPTAWALNRHI